MNKKIYVVGVLLMASGVANAGILTSPGGSGPTISVGSRGTEFIYTPSKNSGQKGSMGADEEEPKGTDWTLVCDRADSGLFAFSPGSKNPCERTVICIVENMESGFDTGETASPKNGGKVGCKDKYLSIWASRL